MLWSPAVRPSMRVILVAAGTMQARFCPATSGVLSDRPRQYDGTARCDIGAYEANALIDKNATFVFQQYIDFFDREPGAGEVSPWVSALDSGLSKADLIEAFMDSEESALRESSLPRLTWDFDSGC